MKREIGEEWRKGFIIRVLESPYEYDIALAGVKCDITTPSATASAVTTGETQKDVCLCHVSSVMARGTQVPFFAMKFRIS